MLAGLEHSEPFFHCLLFTVLLRVSCSICCIVLEMVGHLLLTLQHHYHDEGSAELILNTIDMYWGHKWGHTSRCCSKRLQHFFLSRTAVLCSASFLQQHSSISLWTQFLIFVTFSLLATHCSLKGVNASFYISTRKLQYQKGFCPFILGFRRGLTSNCHFLEKFLRMVNSSV